MDEKKISGTGEYSKRHQLMPFQTQLANRVGCFCVNKISRFNLSELIILVERRRDKISRSLHARKKEEEMKRHLQHATASFPHERMKPLVLAGIRVSCILNEVIR